MLENNIYTIKKCCMVRMCVLYITLMSTDAILVMLRLNSFNRIILTQIRVSHQVGMCDIRCYVYVIVAYKLIF